MSIERYIRLMKPIKFMTKEQIKVIYKEIRDIAQKIENRMIELSVFSDNLEPHILKNNK